MPGDLLAVALLSDSSRHRARLRCHLLHGREVELLLDLVSLCTVPGVRLRTEESSTQDDAGGGGVVDIGVGDDGVLPDRASMTSTDEAFESDRLMIAVHLQWQPRATKVGCERDRSEQFALSDAEWHGRVVLAPVEVMYHHGWVLRVGRFFVSPWLANGE
eukprot:5130276-Pleurochrysis_carterae.AAC.1